MRASTAQLPKDDSKQELQKLSQALKQVPPGKIVGVRSKVALGSVKKNGSS